MSVAEQSTVLSSWKDIAKYLGKGVRTVQRWEQHLGLPVRRPIGASQKSAVLLHREDVDAWLVTRFAARGAEMQPLARVCNSAGSVRAELRENLQKARELTDTQLALTQQIAESIRLLNERCQLLTTRNNQSPWRSTTYAAVGWPVNGADAVAERAS